MQDNTRWIPIYTTSRRLAAFLGYPYLFNAKGEWIGFVNPDGTVYAVSGEYVGYLDPNPRTARILRRQDTAPLHPPATPPPPPSSTPHPSWTVPLPPKPEPLPPNIIDVLERMPELFSPSRKQP